MAEEATDHDRRRHADRAAIRAAALFVLVGMLWVALTDLANLMVFHDAWHETWPRSLNRSLFVLAAAGVVFALVRRYGRQWERAETQAHGSAEALRASESRYRSLVERVPGVVWLNEIDPDDPAHTHCVYVAPQLVDLLGYTPEHWMADEDLWQKVIHADDRTRVLLLNERADEQGTLSMEYRAVRTDGTIVWIHDEAVLLPAEGDRPACWQGIMVDITAQRERDRALHEMTESLHGVFQSAPLAILVLEPDGRVRHWNPAAERLFGWTAEEIVGAPLPYVPDSKRTEHEETKRRTVAGEAVSGFETVRMRKDGSLVDVSLSTGALTDLEGNVTGLLGVVEDITERKKAEARFQAMIDAAPDAMIGVDRDGIIVMANHRTEAVFGHRPEDLIGVCVEALVPDRVARAHPGHRGGYFADPHPRSMGAELELSAKRSDGTEFPTEISLSWIETAEGGVALAAIRDVTERKRITDELALRQRQQEAIAEIGLAALERGDLQAVLDEASRIVVETLRIPMSAILELLPGDETLLLRAGVGWRPGLVASHAIGRGMASLATFALERDEPVIVDDLAAERRFPIAPILLDHGVVSGVATVVYGGREPYGVLEALATSPRTFTRDDVRFLEGIAAIVGLAIERERAESALRTAEEKYRSLVEEGPAVVYLHDADRVPAQVTYIGPQIVDLLGHPAEAWTSDPEFWLSVVHPHDRGRLERADRTAIEHRQPLDVEYRMVAADDREVWVQDRATLVRDAEGSPLFYQGVLVDVTARHRAEDERRSALDRQLRLATRLELLHQIDREVLSSTSIDEMAARTLDHLRLLVHFDRASVALVEPETDRFTYAAVRAEPEMTLATDLESETPSASTRDLLSRDMVVDDLDELESSTSHMAAARAIGIRSVLSIALRTEDAQVGNLILVSRTPKAFDDEAMDIAKEVGSELAIAIAQMRLRAALAERAEELGRLAEERQQMLHRIVRAQEEERERVALELHDGLGQVLTSISLFASDLVEVVPEDARPRAARVNELIRRAIGDSRQIVWSLRPPELERLGLVPALRRLADEISAPELTVDLHEQIGDVRLPPESEAVVYRVVQEAVHNAQKHASASAISIVLQRNDGHLSTLIEDNGRGFDPAAIPSGRGLGLIGMRERAELVEGVLVVESAIEAGTRVRLLVPIGATSVGAKTGPERGNGR